MSENEAGPIERMLQGRRIAVVGLSDDPSRPSFRIANYLQSHGFEILPVNPHALVVLGVRCVPSLADVSGPIDVVNVFRRAEYCPQIVRAAIELGAKGVWLQSGIRSDEASRLAAEAGIDFVQDLCIMVEHANRDRSG